MSNPNPSPATRFQPGNPGGPGRISNWLKPGDLKTVVGKFMKMTRDELKSHMERREAPMLDLIIGQIMVKAVQTGDAHRLEFLLNRTLGRVKEMIDHDEEGRPVLHIVRPNGDEVVAVPLTPDQLKRMGQAVTPAEE
jgi:hypothetical protein